MIDGKWKVMEPIKVGAMVLRNRIVMPAMENIYNNADGSVSQDLIDYYYERARGGVGLIVVQNSHIDTKASRSSYCMLSIATGHMIAGLSKLADAIHSGRAKAVIQLGHGGRQCNPDAIPPGVQHVAPSPIPCFIWGVVPKELSLEEIQEIQDSLVKAAERAQKSGFDGVEVHSAHGYLIGQFISPASNKREDMYGGTLENRARFALEVIEKIRAKMGPDFMIGFRLSADEYVPGGLTIDESTLYAKKVAETGKVDYISVSAATYESVSKMYPVMYSEKGCLLHLAESVKKQVGNVPVIAVGAIDAWTGESALREGKADMVAIGRGLIADPELPDKIAAGKLESIRPCIRCNEGCFTNIASGKSMRCAVNPACGKEKIYRISLPVKGKKVMVIGGGIAGMEAARMLALRGHKVTLVEKSGSLGGHLIEASVPAFKQPLKELLDWEIKQLGATGVQVRMNTEATPDYIRKAKPDVLIVAVGSEWNKPFNNGKKTVVTGQDVLSGKVTPGERVVVIGGGFVGCETALHIAAGSGKKVIIVEMLNQILTGLEILHMIELMERLTNAGVEIRTGLKVIDISETAVICEDAKKQKCEITADTVITCTGMHARKEEAESFKTLAPEVYSIGDCVSARRIMDAFEDAHHAVLQV